MISIAQNLFAVTSFRTGTKFARPDVDVPVQVFGFSPVVTGLQHFTGVFRPFLSCKGVDFSAVTKIWRFIFSPGREGQIEYGEGIGRQP